MIWVDMDGVVADFDGHYENLFGVRPTRWPEPDNIDWKLMASVPDFFLTMPLMHDAIELLDGLRPRPFKMLTGVPSSINSASNHKVDFIRKHVNPPPEVQCCRSRDKCLYGKPGDVLIDDYLKYRDLWVDMGGIFIHHTSAANSLALLRAIEHVRRGVPPL